MLKLMLFIVSILGVAYGGYHARDKQEHTDNVKLMRVAHLYMQMTAASPTDTTLLEQEKNLRSMLREIDPDKLTSENRRVYDMLIDAYGTVR